MDKKECVFNLIVAIGLIAMAAALVFHEKHLAHKDSATESVQVDTVIVRDTIRVVEPAVIKTIHTRDTLLVVANDTIRIHDTLFVNLPVTQEYYKGKDFEAWVSGYRPNLDSLYVFPKTVYVNKTISASSQKRFGIGVQVGYGATVRQSQVFLSPYFGVGVSYNFVQF